MHFQPQLRRGRAKPHYKMTSRPSLLRGGPTNVLLVNWSIPEAIQKNLETSGDALGQHRTEMIRKWIAQSSDLVHQEEELTAKLSDNRGSVLKVTNAFAFQSHANRSNHVSCPSCTATLNDHDRAQVEILISSHSHCSGEKNVRLAGCSVVCIADKKHAHVARWLRSTFPAYSKPHFNSLEA